MRILAILFASAAQSGDTELVMNYTTDGNNDMAEIISNLVVELVGQARSSKQTSRADVDQLMLGKSHHPITETHIIPCTSFVIPSCSDYQSTQTPRNKDSSGAEEKQPRTMRSALMGTTRRGALAGSTLLVAGILALGETGRAAAMGSTSSATTQATNPQTVRARDPLAGEWEIKRRAAPQGDMTLEITDQRNPLSSMQITVPSSGTAGDAGPKILKTNACAAWEGISATVRGSLDKGTPQDLRDVEYVLSLKMTTVKSDLRQLTKVAAGGDIVQRDGNNPKFNFGTGQFTYKPLVQSQEAIFSHVNEVYAAAKSQDLTKALKSLDAADAAYADWLQLLKEAGL